MNLGYSFFIGGCCATCAAWKFLSQADSFQPKGLSPWDRGNLPENIPSHGPATQASRNRENPRGWQERWGGTALTNNIGSGAFERGVNEHMFVRCCETLGWQWCWQECAAQRGLWSQPASQPLGPLFEPWLAHFSLEEVFEHVGDVQFAASCDCFEHCQPHCGNHSMLYRRKASVVDSIVWICHILDHLVSVAVDARVFHEANLCFSGQVVHCPTWSISKREGYFGLGQLSLEFSILDHFLVPTLLYTALVHICDLPAKWSDVNTFGEVGKHGLFNLMFFYVNPNSKGDCHLLQRWSEETATIDACCIVCADPFASSHGTHLDMVLQDLGLPDMGRVQPLGDHHHRELCLATNLHSASDVANLRDHWLVRWHRSLASAIEQLQHHGFRMLLLQCPPCASRDWWWNSLRSPGRIPNLAGLVWYRRQRRRSSRGFWSFGPDAVEKHRVETTRWRCPTFALQLACRIECNRATFAFVPTRMGWRSTWVYWPSSIYVSNPGVGGVLQGWSLGDAGEQPGNLRILHRLQTQTVPLSPEGCYAPSTRSDIQQFDFSTANRSGLLADVKEQLDGIDPLLSEPPHLLTPSFPTCVLLL